MDLGERLQTVRKRRGLTQRELAESSGVSLSLIRKIEQGERDDTPMDTLRRFAVALGCPLTVLLGPDPAPPHGYGGGELWTPTREALSSMRDAPTAEPVSVRSLEAALSHATRLYHDNEYERLARVLPRLIDDANSAPALLRSRTLQLAGSVMVQTRQPDSARIALNQSLTDAESTGNVLDAASAVITLCWLLIVERQFEAVRHLATRWADRVEPRLSVATTRELSTWGWLLLRASAAAVRDNRPDEADEMMRLAAAGAVAVRPESGPYHQYDVRPGHGGYEAGRERRGGRPPGRRVAPGPRYPAGPAADLVQLEY
ncbi:helix-turn-helix transcriptional regulator [Nocardia abscessus]|uniref:helix-turn-helix domain-containing protein n=2 Tax=Nocardia TaxID=1817 RepID=UPI001894F723|nr:helix-turn-helix transcriptional regulator [Nocardia abscessus]MBF6217604.1 helix-turn-helix transcriptional regulator [Nocardia abscessus]